MATVVMVLPSLHRNSSKQEVQAPSHVAEKFIELLCEYKPRKVYGFLKKNENYRLEEALDVSVYTFISNGGLL